MNKKELITYFKKKKEAFRLLELFSYLVLGIIVMAVIMVLTIDAGKNTVHILMIGFVLLFLWLIQDKIGMIYFYMITRDFENDILMIRNVNKIRLSKKGE